MIYQFVTFSAEQLTISPPPPLQPNYHDVQYLCLFGKHLHTGCFVDEMNCFFCHFELHPSSSVKSTCMFLKIGKNSFLSAHDQEKDDDDDAVDLTPEDKVRNKLFQLKDVALTRADISPEKYAKELLEALSLSDIPNLPGTYNCASYLNIYGDV